MGTQIKKEESSCSRAVIDEDLRIVENSVNFILSNRIALGFLEEN